MKKSTYKYKEPPPLGEVTTHLQFHPEEVPDYVRDDLAAATLDFIRRLLSNPETREMLDAKSRERKGQKSGKRTPSGHGANDGKETVDP